MPGEHFGHRSDPESVVFTDRFLASDIGIAQQIPVVNLAAPVAMRWNDPRQLVAVQIRLHRCRNFGTGQRLAFSRGGRGENDQYQAKAQGLRVCLS